MLYSMRFQEQNDATKVITKPVDYTEHIPAEILSEIFWKCVIEEGWDDLDRYPGEYNPRKPEQCHQAPWSFSQVSQWWRNVALGNSNLWKFISIAYCTRYRIEHGDAVEKSFTMKDECLALQLERSGSQPLFVKIEGSLTSKLAGAPGFQKFLVSSKRWEYLAYAVDIGSSLKLLAQVDEHLEELPLLVSLNYIPHSRIWLAPHLATHAPNLRTIRGYIAREYPANIHWSQIVELDHEIYNEDLDQLTKLIPTVPNVQTLKLRFNSLEREAVGVSQNVEPLNLPLIRSLSLTCQENIAKSVPWRGVLFVAPLQAFTLPALESLELVDRYPTKGHFPINDLRAMLQRGGMELRSLRFVAISLPVMKHEYKKLFETVRSLQRLELVDIAFNAVQMLLLELKRDSVLSSLQTVTVAMKSKEGKAGLLSDIQDLTRIRPNLVISLT
ncbi:hypothetical protein C8J56DRAFT_921306 [Mycena floridula]|nr:hypothetical protein C8J56DRAFT_921306 [Mycena floridula]